MFALIGAYFLVSFAMIEADGLAFQALNCTGGLALVLFSISKNATQLAFLNAFWAFIGFMAILRSFL